MIRLELLGAIAVLSTCAALIAWLFMVALTRARNSRNRALLSAKLAPQMQAALVDYLAGSEDLTRLRGLAAASRRDLSNAVLSFQRRVGGAARDRLCNLSLELSLVHDWRDEIHSRDITRRRAAFDQLAFVSSYEPCRRVAGDLVSIALDDKDPEVRLSAARALAEYGEMAEIERVFGMAISQNPLIRMLLTGDLRRHSVELCRKAVPRALGSGDREQVLAALGMLAAWQRAVPLEGLLPLIEHGDRTVKIQALELLPLVPNSRDNRSAVLRALADDDTDVCIAAAAVAGRLGLVEGLPQLARCLRSGQPQLARAAAATLSGMAPQGTKTLEELAVNSNAVTASAAAEALERVKRNPGT